jgi:hypothetical protein
MAKILLKYVEEFIDQHGKPHRYFPRAGKRVRLPGLPGSAEYMAAYQVALDGIPAPKIEAVAPRTAPGTVHWLVTTYLSSAIFEALAPETQRTRRNILENFRKADGEKRIFVTVSGEPKMVLDSPASATSHQQEINDAIRAAQFAQHFARYVSLGGE